MATTTHDMETWVDVDWAKFDPWRIQPLRHHVQDHPLMQMDALLALAQRLDAAGSVRTHSDSAKAGTPFNSAPELFPNGTNPVETLRNLARAQAWMSLLNIQKDPLYRTLVRGVLDELQPEIDDCDPGMSYRGGWIFVTSPNAVTPYHFDAEHNFILQVQGRKRVYVWAHDDVEVASEQARDLFHLNHERYLLRWRDAFRERAQVIDLQPGQGAYMPSTSPHMVENGDGPSVTVSFTYYTDATREKSRLHAGHGALRKLGLQPSPIGQSGLSDALGTLLLKLRGDYRDKAAHARDAYAEEAA
ncbi:cupin-like domain-containing protein [Solilutibacter silvestris]|uniref:Cupin-like domain-containing protein n=1 Tax=Solilutibacter silvestris TaxID=1645665 RepID=A0A2K1PZB1_9GAMM|nr:cupin-like domain-containing protein [Lysobacter silvestris]PNS08132.1 Cupin-like domain-containing protein [Lysobacter silvestris]